MQKIGIFFGSSTGNTEEAAIKIQQELGENITDVINVSEAEGCDVDKYENLILGASTWGIGDLQDDYEIFLPALEKANLNNKKIAIFGLGDQEAYPDSFVDAIGIIYEAIEAKGCKIVGSIENTGYEFDESKAEIDGKLVGLPIDDDNESNLTNERIKTWTAQLKKEFELN